MGKKPNKETEEALKELEAGIDIKTVETVEELFEELEKDDSSTE